MSEMSQVGVARLPAEAMALNAELKSSFKLTLEGLSTLLVVG